MLLYVKCSSDRASKGQGGNEFVDIDLMSADREVLCRLVFRLQDNDSEKAYLLVRDRSIGNDNIEVRT